jgi:hypothetical protein
MDFTQHIDADKLSIEFVNYVKDVFKGKRIKLTVESEPDDTTYLMSNKANHKRLLKAMKNSKNPERLVKLDKEVLKKIIS